MAIKYRPAVLEELARHGIVPNDETPAELVHEFISALYVYEIRALRQQMRAGLIEKKEYPARVAGLRGRYPILSLPIRYWMECNSTECN
jgi:hypothetical protein